MYGPPEWHQFVAKEYEACRERVGLIDMSSFSKFDIMVDSYFSNKILLLFAGARYGPVSSARLLCECRQTDWDNNLHG